LVEQRIFLFLLTYLLFFTEIRLAWYGTCFGSKNNAGSNPASPISLFMTGRFEVSYRMSIGRCWFESSCSLIYEYGVNGSTENPYFCNISVIFGEACSKGAKNPCKVFVVGSIPSLSIEEIYSNHYKCYKPYEKFYLFYLKIPMPCED
jgi:hypothetical protein